MMIKNNTEYNEYWQFWCWLVTKPEYGGPQHKDEKQTKKQIKEVLAAIKEYENRSGGSLEWK